MARVLITGMSGTGKSTLLTELARRGHLVLDTDHDGWVRPDGRWDEPRMWSFLEAATDVVVSGTVDNQGSFYPAFRHVVLLSAPLPVLIERLSTGRPTLTARPRSIGGRSAGASTRSSPFFVEGRPSSWTPGYRSRP